MSPDAVEVVDSFGRPLQVGDVVQSVKRYDRAYAHLGKVTGMRDGTITVRHRRTCCGPGRISSDCDPRLWTRVDRVFKRKTAWEKILADDD